jgi:mannose-1-phosphate guanylyltransferase / mannose-6-phosphate isomerase
MLAPLTAAAARGFSKHRLRNPGEVALELIEVQSGSYLGEDDIVRYDDVYGRA